MIHIVKYFVHKYFKIVRAGRTGKDEDNMVFYMTREQ